jgi:hypothetical protein
MVQISEVLIISADKSEDTWAIEGEIVFESELTTAFSCSYTPKEDELEDLIIEINPGKYDKAALKAMIVRGAEEFED